MWARFVEIALGLWLLVATGVLPDPGGGVATVNGVAGVAVLVLASLSFTDRLHWAHLGHLLVAVFLVGWGWSQFPRPGPWAAQNQILTGLMLALVAVIPSESGRPPHAWREYVAEKEEG